MVVFMLEKKKIHVQALKNGYDGKLYKFLVKILQLKSCYGMNLLFSLYGIKSQERASAFKKSKGKFL